MGIAKPRQEPFLDEKGKAYHSHGVLIFNHVSVASEELGFCKVILIKQLYMAYTYGQHQMFTKM